MMICDLCDNRFLRTEGAHRMARGELGVNDVCPACAAKFNESLETFHAALEKDRAERYAIWLHNLKCQLRGVP